MTVFLKNSSQVSKNIYACKPQLVNGRIYWVNGKTRRCGTQLVDIRIKQAIIIWHLKHFCSLN